MASLRTMRWGKAAVAGATALLTLIAGVRVLRALEWRVRSRFAAQSGEPVLRPLDEAFVRDFWGERNGYAYDPLAHLVRASGVDETWDWEEHPSHTFRMRTNAQGFREDTPTPLAFDGLRIVVAGDSHTDGVVENAASFANLAERELAIRLGRPVDVVNAGVGYTGPRCYLGMLRKCLSLDPDVFVTVLYAGNDFSDELGLAYHLGERKKPVVPKAYHTRAVEVAADFLPFYQGLNQSFRFTTFPDEAELALALALESVYAIDELCRANDVSYLLVLLPTKMDVDEDGREEWLAACERLGLTERDTATSLALGRRLLDAARQKGIECFDPTDALRAADVPLFWRADHHLGFAGHARLATLLSERLAEIAATRAR